MHQKAETFRDVMLILLRKVTGNYNVMNMDALIYFRCSKSYYASKSPNTILSMSVLAF